MQQTERLLAQSNKKFLIKVLLYLYQKFLSQSLVYGIASIKEKICEIYDSDVLVVNA